MISDASQIDTTCSDETLPAPKSYTFIIIKEHGLELGMDLAVENLFDEKEKSPYLPEALRYQKPEPSSAIATFISKSKIVGCYSEFGELLASDPELMEEFWWINYHLHADKFYYDELIRSSHGKSSLYLLEYDGIQTELDYAIKNLKGKNAISISSQDQTEIVKGSGLRNFYPIRSIRIDNELISSFPYTDKQLSELRNFISSKDTGDSKGLTFYQFSYEHQALIYNALSQDLKDELVNHKIHVPDDANTYFQSMITILSKFYNREYLDEIRGSNADISEKCEALTNLALQALNSRVD